MSYEKVTFILLVATLSIIGNLSQATEKKSDDVKCNMQSYMYSLTYYVKLRQQKNMCFDKINTTQQPERKCKDPSSEEISKTLLKMLNIFNEGERMLNIPVLKDIIKNITIINDNVNLNSGLIYGSTECQPNLRNSQNALTICPWHYVTIYREDRYPKLKSYAKCNCKSCQSSHKPVEDDVSYSCRPYYQKELTLVRDKCEDGKYEWIPMIELIPTICLCQRDDKNIDLDTKGLS